MTADTLTKDETIRLQAAEIERLNNLVRLAIEEKAAVFAEIERLTRCIESCEETNDRVGTENERLRELLHEALDDAICNDWYVRVREALGE